MIPTRQTVEEKASRDAVVFSALRMHRMGELSYEQSLRLAVVALMDEREKMLKEEIRKLQRSPVVVDVEKFIQARGG